MLMSLTMRFCTGFPGARCNATSVVAMDSYPSKVISRNDTPPQKCGWESFNYTATMGGYVSAGVDYDSRNSSSKRAVSGFISREVGTLRGATCGSATCLSEHVLCERSWESIRG